MPTTVRPYDEGDRAALRAFDRDTFPGKHDSTVLDDWLSHNKQLYVGVADGHVVGFAVLVDNQSGHYDLIWVGVARTRRGQGIGAEIVEGVQQLRRVHSLTVAVRPHTPTDWLERLGFRARPGNRLAWYAESPDHATRHGTVRAHPRR
jgi:GNAT superfamily N-acetyltransferase